MAWCEIHECPDSCCERAHVVGHKGKLTVVLHVTVEGGKYEVRQFSDGKVVALRNGAIWRDLTGDKLVLALAQEIDNLTVRP